jgi:hypothetical protein
MDPTPPVIESGTNQVQVPDPQPWFKVKLFITFGRFNNKNHMKHPPIRLRFLVFKTKASFIAVLWIRNYFFLIRSRFSSVLDQDPSKIAERSSFESYPKYLPFHHANDFKVFSMALKTVFSKKMLDLCIFNAIHFDIYIKLFFFYLC